RKQGIKNIQFIGNGLFVGRLYCILHNDLSSGIIFTNFDNKQSTPMALIRPFVVVMLIALLAACSAKPFGTKVKEPFQGNAYESNNRFWRASGKGVSSQDNIARGKADMDAKAQLAGQVNTTMKQV